MLAEFLKSVGLDISFDANTSSSPPAACKKCSRKIVNCSTLFHELKGILIAKSNSQSAKRLHGNRSPRGSTPDPKKAKDIPQEPQEKGQRQPTIRARKSLFELNTTWTERERQEDAVANLMNLFGIIWHIKPFPKHLPVNNSPAVSTLFALLSRNHI